MKQIDYEYSLLDTEELTNKTNLSENDIEDIIENEDTAYDWDKNNFKEGENVEIENSTTDTKNIQNNDKLDNENWQKNKDEDFKERAQIFKSF